MERPGQNITRRLKIWTSPTHDMELSILSTSLAPDFNHATEMAMATDLAPNGYHLTPGVEGHLLER